MTLDLPRILIEDWLPIEAIGAESKRERGPAAPCQRGISCNSGGTSIKVATMRSISSLKTVIELPKGKLE